MAVGELGAFEHVSGRPALRFERRIEHPAGAVWGALTEPGELAHWFPQAVRFSAIEPGADVVFNFQGENRPADTGRVVDAAPRELLVFTWFGDTLTFELEDGEATVLRFTHLLGDVTTAARTMAGWHVCLDRLGAYLDGDVTRAPGPAATDEWRALYDEYVARGVPHGAPVPGR
jgi:uncharacterized protein YndB with AHSA1/START domain